MKIEKVQPKIFVPDEPKNPNKNPGIVPPWLREKDEFVILPYPFPIKQRNQG